jgi:hypothetical protein
MATNLRQNEQIMAVVPSAHRDRIVSGVRWTMWLSLLVSPLGYCTSLILARLGPQVQLALIWIAPVYGLHMIVLSAIKGLMDIRFFQIMVRLILFSTFVIYSTLFLAARVLKT